MPNSIIPSVNMQVSVPVSSCSKPSASLVVEFKEFSLPNSGVLFTKANFKIGCFISSVEMTFDAANIVECAQDVYVTSKFLFAFTKSAHMLYICPLTSELYFLSIFVVYLRSVPIVYRLVDPALVAIFFDDPFLF